MGKLIFISISTIFFLISCNDNIVKNCNGQYIKINELDSVCLNLHIDIDSNQIKKIITQSKSKTLIVFTGYTVHDKDLLSNKFLSNEMIRNSLKDITIIRLNVDNHINKNDTIFASGDENVNFQKNKYGITSQPYSIFVDKDLNQIGKSLSYTNDEIEVLNFLKIHK